MTDNRDPRGNRWGMLGIIMLGTFMAILDSSIVNVALPHMMSTFGVDREQIEWVATGFMLTSAVVMPLVGWLTNRISYKALYLGSLLVFTLASAVCAMAWSYESLIVARILQALGGGAILPIGMAIVAEVVEPHERGKALGIWGMGIMAGPAIGPTLGGYLTDAFSWRTIFSVNLPVGALTLLAGMIVMRPLRAHGARRAFDLFGYVFLSMALIAGLTALSNGQVKGWHSDYIRACEAITVVGLVMFIAVELAVEHPLLDLRLFIIRNYLLSILLTIFRSVALFGSVFLFPIFLQNLMGYTPVDAGLWMLPNAVAVGLTMPLAGRLADRYRPSRLAAFGCILVGCSLIVFGLLDPLSDWTLLVLPQFARGVGLALMIAPLLATALNAVPRHQLAMASAFLNVFMNVGGSLGIALLNNYVSNSIHVHAVRMGGVFPVKSEAFYRFALRTLPLEFPWAHGTLATSQVKSAFVATREIMRRAQVLGFDNGFVLAGLIVLAGIPLALQLKSSAHHLNNGAKAEVIAE
jgi:EmrB/QacA subfamily drug resistance transporter